MRPYVQVNTTPTATATTSTQSPAPPTSAAVPTTTANDSVVKSSFTKRSYDDAKKAFLNYSPSDNYVYSNLLVNKSKSSAFTLSQQQQQLNTLWTTHFPDTSQSTRCIDSTNTAKSVTVLPSDNDTKQKCANAEQSILISDKKLLSATPFDTANTSSTSHRSPFIALNAKNTRTIGGCEVNRVKFVNCDNSFGDTRPLYVGAENVKNSGSHRTSSSMLQNKNNTINDIQSKRAEIVTPMSNSLNSNNCETRSTCQNSNSSEETTALLIENDPSKSITVQKAGNASLIFTKKESNPVVHRKRNVYLRTVGNGSRSTLTASVVDPTEDTSSGKRHSFHSEISSKDRKRKQVKSWYAIISSADANGITDENTEVSRICGNLKCYYFIDFHLDFYRFRFRNVF